MLKIDKVKNGYRYKSDNGKKVKFINNETQFSEIVIKYQTNKIVEGE